VIGTQVLSANVLGLTGDIPVDVLAVRGLDAPAVQYVDHALPTLPLGVVTVRAQLATLDQMCASAGVDVASITTARRDLWRDTRPSCTLELVDMQLVTTLTFGG